jgi:nitrate/nitrite transporter NarK
LLIGASVAVAFVSMLKLASHWFTPRQFTLASGMALFVGIIGGVFAGVPLRLLVEAFNWRWVMGASAAVTALLCVVIWLRVRDDPAELGYASHFTGAHEETEHGSVSRGLREVLSYGNVWLLAVTPGGVAGAVMTFAGLWGVPYLTQVYGIGARDAAAICSMLLVAWALGGPVLGTWSERIGRRKPLYVAAAGLTLAGWGLIVFVPPLPLSVLIALLLVLGFASGCIIIGFAYAKESVPLRLTGTAAGVTNMGTMMGVMVLQPAVGWALDRQWSGATIGGVRVYDVAAYRAGFALIVAWLVLSFICIALTRETHCKQRA